MNAGQVKNKTDYNVAIYTYHLPAEGRLKNRNYL